MNKYQLIEILAMHEGLSFKTAEVIVNTLFTNISESLVPRESRDQGFRLIQGQEL